jgi:hypothetical protein
VHYGVEEITVNVRKMFKKFYWTYLLIWRSLKVAPNRSNKCIKLSWKLPLIVCIITKYKITHYQYPILHNRKFRSLGNRKNYLKSTKATLQGNDVRVYLCLHCTIIFAIIDFFVSYFFPFFFHVHLNILDQVVSSECAIFGTPV